MIYSGLWKTAAMLVLVFGYAVFFGGAVPYFIFYTSLALVVISFLMALVSGRITASCSANCTASQIGSQIRVTIEVTNYSGLPVPWVQCWVAMPATFGLPGSTACYNLSLAPKEKRVISEDLPCLTRGCFQWGQITLRTGDIFGFFSCISNIDVNRELTVWPEIHYLDFALSHGSSMSFSGVRSYQAGDSMSKIHWKASARTGTLLVKEYQDHEPPELTIFLDLIDGHHAGLGPESSVEKAVSLAASLAFTGLGKGYRMGLVVCSNDPVMIAPGHGRQQLAMIMQALARVSAVDTSRCWSAAVEGVKSRIKNGGALLITGVVHEVGPQTITSNSVYTLSGKVAERIIGQCLRVIPVTGQTDLRRILGGLKNEIG